MAQQGPCGRREESVRQKYRCRRQRRETVLQYKPTQDLEAEECAEADSE